jgi:hypothetical protein
MSERVEVDIPQLRQFDVQLAAPAAEDLGYIRRTWFESYKHSPAMDRLSWPIFKQTSGRVIDALLGRNDVHLLAAYDADGKVVGWCAWTPGKSVATLHWVYVRHAIGENPTRRRGVAAVLLDAAKLGRRVVYTFRGARRSRGQPSLDISLAEWAKRQGVTATYAPVEEFLR